ncbi:Protein kish-B [Aphelenchoides besseyi]|nr:Protein kish-B [Aphelenchoides besseyi]
MFISLLQTKLPKGVKQKVKKVQTKKQPRKGSHIILPAKKNTAMEEAKVSATVSRVINEKNEQMVRTQADKSQGRISGSK